MKYISTILAFAYSFSTAVAAGAENNLPDIGSSASKVFSLVQEQAVGDSYMRQLRAIAPLMNDSEVNDYIQHLGFRLVENNPRATNRKFSFFVLDQTSINAFALPGGYIGLHTGLINKTENESELASVIGHEIAHVTQRHLARRIELQSQLTLPSLAAFVAAILIATQAKGSDGTLATLTGSQALAKQAIINHTRAGESEADRIGILAMYQAGFDPNAAVTFFEKMQQNTAYRANAIEFLQTHPLSRNRITDARLRARELPRRMVIEKPTYRLIKQKIKALTSKINPTVLKSNEVRFENGEFNTNELLYGYSILLMRGKKFKRSEEILLKLRRKNPGQTSFVIALAELDIIKQTPERSLPIVEKFLDRIPGNLALVEMNAKLLLAVEKPKKARELLLENVHMTSFAPHLFKLLARAQEEAGYFSEVYETEGNYLLSFGDLSGARNQYHQALNAHTEDPYARERINSQLRRIKEFLYKRSLQR